MLLLKGWRYALVVGSLVGLTLAAAYPIIIDPYFNPRKWQELQKVARKGIDREKTQPGGMKVWTDPFAKKE
ncbi:small integral membrane protein 20-like [Octopus bimaculoides]|uniref:small integral membrane protein 20-like n=1 Tax=Octopus bimaculoides TaxID=37653 RepID=UPI00071CB7FE|nr:small integral membrane protein 20-like [Octopus bimaculoides]|eukprot:XP_014769837.1 PREDICTED: small integral membrane protein 20-like [Octopus bimaculoides]